MLTEEQLVEFQNYAQNGRYEQDMNTVLKPLTQKEKMERDKII